MRSLSAPLVFILTDTVGTRSRLLLLLKEIFLHKFIYGFTMSQHLLNVCRYGPSQSTHFLKVVQGSHAVHCEIQLVLI